MTQPAEPIALVDMDGTLCDYDQAMRRDLCALASPEERLLLDDTLSLHLLEKEPHWKARMDLIKRVPGWWRGLPRIEQNFEIFSMLERMDFILHVLTKGPWATTSAWSEKVEWCREHLPPGVGVHVGEDKGLVYGKVLVDDYPPYIERWLTWRPRGLVIMPAQPWNATFTNPNVVRWDGSGTARAKIQARAWAVRQTARQG